MKQKGVVRADISWQEGKGEVLYDPVQITPSQIVAAMPSYYPAQVVKDEPYPGLP